MSLSSRSQKSGSHSPNPPASSGFPGGPGRPPPSAVGTAAVGLATRAGSGAGGGGGEGASGGAVQAGRGRARTAARRSNVSRPREAIPSALLKVRRAGGRSGESSASARTVYRRSRPPAELRKKLGRGPPP